jgi:hypothetical protein
MIFSVLDTGIGITAKQPQLFLKSNLPVAFGAAGEKGSGPAEAGKGNAPMLL